MNTAAHRTTARMTRFSIVMTVAALGRRRIVTAGMERWQRSRRHAARPTPRSKPCSWMASRAYSEQVGANRQAPGRSGETSRW
jgi:hypothetical protein